MKKSLIIISALAMFLSLFGCKGASSAQNEENSETLDPAKTIVIYYSQTGATKAVAEEIQSKLSCDIAPIVAETPYDGDYPSTIQRWMQEKQDSVKVSILPLDVDLGNYDTIFLGFPIWGGTFASPMATFLTDNSLKGKKVITFATFGSGGIEQATADVALLQPDAEVVEGYGVRNARVAKSPAEINRFLIENGYMKGEAEQLPPYSEPEAVSDETVAIFHAACDNYQFPLGTPVKVATRTVGTTNEYKFDVTSRNPEGEETNAIIYVTAPEGEAPEFTRVVR